MGTSYNINDTSSYHREELKTLGWELTVTNALEDPQSPCRGILEKPGSFGDLLFDFLQAHIPVHSISSLLEIGGGYGFLMRDFLRRGNFANAAMLDLSPVLLNKQRETVSNPAVSFIEQDFFQIEPEFFSRFDLIVLNEIIGDFPTVCNLSPEIFNNSDANADLLVTTITRCFREYAFPFPKSTFTINLGAIEAVEKLCAARVSYIYLSEHSCEAAVPEDMKDRIAITCSHAPEKISLMGHCEYTIQFSYLERIARSRGYRVLRGQYKDIITVPYTDRVNFILTSHSQKDDHEIIRQFIEDLYKYEYMLLIRQE